MAYTNPSYCAVNDLKDIYPQIDEFDTKTPIYGWSETGTSNLYLARNSGIVNQLFVDGEDLGDAEANSGVVNTNGEWYYDSNLDTVYYFNSASDPADLLMESGEDWATHQTDLIQKGSAYFNSRVDANLPREQFKNSDGEYDYLVVRTTALITCNFLVKAQNPLSEMIEIFEEEINFNLELINSGKAKLSYQVSGDSSKGIVKEISVSGGIKLVDTRGHYSGTYDRLKVQITTEGASGVGKYTVWGKSSDDLKDTVIVANKLINGDYQELAGGLQIRFQGVNDSAQASLADQWEVEVFGQQESLDDNIGAVKYTSMTRTSRPFRKGYGYRL